ncbi:MAG: DUF3108 domain-containing protein [Gemmatimonadales bacterium]
MPLLLTLALAVQVPVPFRVGESLAYDGTYRVAGVPISHSNVAALTVAGVDTVDGVPCWRFTFNTDFSFLFYHAHDELTSWTSVDSFVSRRFLHRIDDTGYSRHDDFRIFADSGFFRDFPDTTRRATPSAPLDDVAFFYFLRLPSTRLDVGNTYMYRRYFRDDRNPVAITVIRREACDLPGGEKATCLVLRPVVEDPPHGMLMREKHALIWITDDARRLPVRVASGPFTMKLSEIVEPH